MTLFE
jgi:hypothetical protein